MTINQDNVVVAGKSFVRGNQMSVTQQYPQVVHIRAYREVKGLLGYAELPIDVEMLRELGPVGQYIIDQFDAKFEELANERPE